MNLLCNQDLDLRFSMVAKRAEKIDSLGGIFLNTAGKWIYSDRYF